MVRRSGGGSDKAPVRLAQDDPRHRQTIVNLLCAYLRMPYRPASSPDDELAMQERLVRGAVQNVLESHLKPEEPERFWPDIDLTLTGANFEFFWFRHCQARQVDFRYVTFHQMGAFRGTRFTGRAHFQHARFAGGADLRGISGDWMKFRGVHFEGDVDFGDEPAEVRNVNLEDATAAQTAERSWPAGWTEEPDPDAPDQVRVVRSA